MGEIRKLPNIGKVIEEQLEQAGITTKQQLIEVGSRQAWLRIKTFDPSACYNRLCGLEGAVQGVRWHDLSPEAKQELKEFYNEYK